MIDSSGVQSEIGIDFEEEKTDLSKTKVPNNFLNLRNPSKQFVNTKPEIIEEVDDENYKSGHQQQKPFDELFDPKVKIKIK